MNSYNILLKDKSSMLFDTSCIDEVEMCMCKYEMQAKR